MLKTKNIFLVPEAVGFLCFFFLVTGCASRYTVSPTPERTYPGEINRHVRLIKADHRQIFRALTNPEALHRLCPAGTVVSYLSQPPYAEGGLVETRIDHIFKLKWTSRVTHVAAGRYIRLVFLDGFFSGGTEVWELTPQLGGTRVSHSIYVEPAGFLRRLAWVIKVRRKHDKMVELFLDNLEKAVAPVTLADQ